MKCDVLTVDIVGLGGGRVSEEERLGKSSTGGNLDSLYHANSCQLLLVARAGRGVTDRAG